MEQLMHRESAAWRRWCLLVHTRAEEAAVNRDALPSDKARGIGSQQGCESDQLFSFSKAVHGRAHAEFVAARRPVQKLGVDRGTKHSGSDSIDADFLFGPFHCQLPRQA